jgi:hypothetical protein
MQVSRPANDNSLPTMLEDLRLNEDFHACDYAKPQIQQERNGYLHNMPSSSTQTPSPENRM